MFILLTMRNSHQLKYTFNHPCAFGEYQNCQLDACSWRLYYLLIENFYWLQVHLQPALTDVVRCVTGFLDISQWQAITGIKRPLCWTQQFFQLYFLFLLLKVKASAAINEEKTPTESCLDGEKGRERWERRKKKMLLGNSDLKSILFV